MVLVYHFELNIISIGMSLLTLTQSQDQIGHSGGDFPPLQRSQLESTTDDNNTDLNELCAFSLKGKTTKSCFKMDIL